MRSPFRIVCFFFLGYYRVNYDTFHWWTLINHLKSSNYNTIHEINRAALIDDLFNLARAGDVSYSTVISAMQYLKQYKESNYLPWLAFYNNLPYLNDRFRGGVVENLYKVWFSRCSNNRQFSRRQFSLLCFFFFFFLSNTLYYFFPEKVVDKCVYYLKTICEKC